MTKTSRGFTLVELMVVLAIIGLLSSIILTSLNAAREKARDATRKSQVVEFQKALELYYSRNGNYPCGISSCVASVVPLTSDPLSNPGVALVGDEDISSIPSDPLYPPGTPNTATSCNTTTGTAGYCYCSPGTDSYVLTVNTEDDTKGDPTSDRCYIRVGPNASGYCASHQAVYAKIDCSQRF